VKALAALAGSWAVTLWVMPWSDERVSDVFVFRTDASWFLDGLLPYRNVLFEYPPLAALPIGLPGLAGTDASTYRLAFALLMLACAACVLLLVRALARRTGGDELLAVAGVALAPLVTGAMIRNHFDLLPVALLLAALVLLLERRAVAGFTVLGLAAMTKGFPIVVAPVALAWVGGRAAVRGAIALVAVVAVLSAAAVAISPSGSLDAIRYQTDRPVQVESLPALVVRAVDPRAKAVSSYRSDGLVSPAGGPAAAGFAALGLGAIGLLSLGAARGRDPRTLVLASLGAVAAFATFGKVVSPQYLVWVLPLGALALAWRRWALAGAVAAATFLTFLEFPSRYFELVADRPLPVAIVAARDCLLVAVVALVIREVVPVRNPAARFARST
jgi:hypothetical protein